MFPPLTPVVRNLLILNIFAFAAAAFFPIIDQAGAMRVFGTAHWQPLQLVTYMFLHGSFFHILSNMFGLVMFGPVLEHTFGPKRFLMFYMVCGIGAGVLYAASNYWEVMQMQMAATEYLQLLEPDLLLRFLQKYDNTTYQLNWSFINEAYPNNPTNPEYVAMSRQMVANVLHSVDYRQMVGASGAVFGILMGFALLYPNVEMMLLFPPIPIKAKYFVGLYGLYELYALYQNSTNDNVAHLAHLGGMLFAFLLIRYWGYRRRNSFF